MNTIRYNGKVQLSHSNAMKSHDYDQYKTVAIKGYSLILSVRVTYYYDYNT